MSHRLESRRSSTLPISAGTGALVQIAVLIPCYNEAATIARVVRAFAAHLPGAAIYVYDNNSTDGTLAVAREAGAVVRSERLQGKGMSSGACSPMSTQTRS